jgi:nondiscriminating glutamyl-tRNA synthetase
VDRLDEIPLRLRFLFTFDPASAIRVPEVAEVLAYDGAHSVVECLARELADRPRLTDRERFRAVVNEIKRQTGRKAKQLFHPIRIALTGEAGGPELDLAVPAIDLGAELPGDAGLAPILGCRERAAAFAATIARLQPSVGSGLS